MTVLRFHGKVDPWSDFPTMTIGGVDVVAAIQAVEFASPVSVALADARFDAERLYAYEGSPGYSEWTPPEVPELVLRGPGEHEHDLWPRLTAMEGLCVTLWIADEPVNLLGEE